MTIDQNTAEVNTVLEPTAPQLREIKDGDNFSTVTQYLGNKKVDAVFSFRPYAGATRYEKKCHFDFGGVTEAQLYDLAMYAVRVKVQHILRSLSRDVMLDPKTLSNVDVLVDVVQTNRGEVDPKTQVERIMRRAGVSEDIVQEALASMTNK